MSSIVVAGMMLAGAALGPPARGLIATHSVAWGQPWRTQCPRCEQLLRHRPVLVALLSPSGTCRWCHNRIGPPAFVVEASLAMVFGVLAWRVPQPLPLLALCWMAAFAVCLAFVDMAVHRLPDRLVSAAFAGGALAFVAASLTGHGMQRVLIAGAVGLGLAAIYLLLAIFGGYGMGDVKFALVVGLAAGWFGIGPATIALVVAAALTALTGVVLVAAGRPLRANIPHGPAMAVGAIVAIAIAA